MAPRTEEIAYPAVEHDEPAAFFSSVNVVVDLGAAINVFLWQRILDAFCDAIGVSAAIVDVQGNILVDARWRNICKDFHWCKLSRSNCANDTTQLAETLVDRSVSLHTCQNGMTDAARLSSSTGPTSAMSL